MLLFQVPFPYLFINLISSFYESKGFVYLDTGRVKAHVVHPPAGRVDPSMTQSFLQCLQRNVKTNNHVELAGTVQSLSLG